MSTRLLVFMVSWSAPEEQRQTTDTASSTFGLRSSADVRAEARHR